MKLKVNHLETVENSKGPLNLETTIIHCANAVNSKESSTEYMQT